MFSVQEQCSQFKNNVLGYFSLCMFNLVAFKLYKKNPLKLYFSLSNGIFVYVTFLEIPRLFFLPVQTSSEAMAWATGCSIRSAYKLHPAAIRCPRV